MFKQAHAGSAAMRGAIAILVVGLAVAAGGGVPPRAAAHSSAGSGIAAPCVPAGHSASTIPSISFGRIGGNIRPMTINLYGDGTVAYKGSAAAPAAGYAVHADAILGLKKLADAEGFATWPAILTSTHLFPDSASLFVTIRAGCATSTKTVTMRPGANQPGFLELWYTLYAAAGLGNR